jgi:hypothetical protein
LTAAELELLHQSWAEPIKALSAKPLTGKGKRTQLLRDKYRDLHRRQFVVVREKTKGVGATGDANARTQRKAEIMQEVLDRFEVRSSLLETREVQSGETKVAKSTRPARRAAAPVASAKPAPPARKSAAESKQRSNAALAPSPAPVTASRKGSIGAKAGKTKTGQPQAAEQPLSAIANLKPTKATQAAPALFIGKGPAVRSPKAPSPRASTLSGKAHAPEVNAPLDMVAAAKRVNPVKNSPSSQAIQGHVSSSVRRSQGKRDSR